MVRLIPSVRVARSLGLGLGLGVMTSGCRTECAAEGKASKEQIEREQKAMLRGQGICWELLTPKIQVTDDRVMVTGAKESLLMKREELPTKAVSFVPALSERLHGYRTHFKTIRAEPYIPTLYATFDPALEPVRAASLLTTAAHAGFPRMHLITSGLDLDLEWWMRVSDDTPEKSTTLCVEPRGDKGWALRFQPETTPPQTGESASTEALTADVEKLCAGRAPCADAIGIGERERATVADMARATAAVVGAGPFKEHHQRVIFLTTAPIEASKQAGPRFERRPCGR